MAKYSSELKRRIDEEYLFGRSTNRVLAEKYQTEKLMPDIYQSLGKNSPELSSALSATTATIGTKIS